ncbi:hypothetical protein D3C77_712100 [compost metagenome]
MGVLARMPSFTMKAITARLPVAMQAIAPLAVARRQSRAPMIGTSMPPTSRL